MKKFLLILLIFFVVVIGALAIVPLLFKDRLVTLAQEQINANVNATISVKDIDVSIFKDFPDITLTVEGVGIVGKDKFKGVSLAQVGELAVVLDILSVIKGEQLAVEDIRISDSDINILVLEDGSANYDIALPSEDEEEVEEEESSDFSLKLKNYAIQNANLSYIDKSMGVDCIVKELNHQGQGDFTLSNFVLQTLTDIKALTVSYEGISYLAGVKTNLDAGFDIDMDKMLFILKENNLRLNGLDLGINGSLEMPNETDMVLDFGITSKKSEFKNLISLIPAIFLEGFESLKADGTFSLDIKAKGTYNETNYPAFSADLLIDKGLIQYPDLPAAIKNISAAMHVEMPEGTDLDKITVLVEKFHMDMANNPIDFYLSLKTPMSDPDVKAKLFADLDFASLEKVMPLEGYKLAGKLSSNLRMEGRYSSLEKEQYDAFQATGLLALKNFTASGDSLPYPIAIDTILFSFTPQFAELKTFRGEVAGIKMQSDGKLENYLGYVLGDETIKGRVNFSADVVDVNKFMSDDVASETTAVENTVPMEVIEIPANIDFELLANINELIYDNMSLKNFKGKVIVKDKKLSFENVETKTLGGDVLLNGYYSTVNNSPDFKFDFEVLKLDINTTSKTLNTVATLAPLVKSATGKFDAKFSVLGSLGEDMMPILTTLNGEGLVKTFDLFFENFEPFNKLASELKLSRLTKQNIKDSKIQFAIEQGKVMVKPFTTKIGDFDADIQGYTSIDQTMDYSINLKIPRDKLGSEANAFASNLAGKLSDKLGGGVQLPEIIDVAVRMTNTITDPKIKLGLGKQDLGKSIKDQAKDKAKEEFDKAKADAEAKIRAEADKAKAQAQEEVDKAKAKAQAEADKAKAEAEKRIEEEKQKAKDAAKEKAKGFFK